jgi:DNA-binding MarR family transcriptional regulator
MYSDEFPAGIDLAVLVSLAGRAVERSVGEALHAAGLDGLRTGHGFVIQRLIERSATAGEMAAAIGVSQQSVSRSLAELTAGGYVASHRDPADQRRRLQHLTDRGRTAVEQTRAVRGQIVADLRARVGDDDLAAAERVVHALLDVLGALPEIRDRAVRPGDGVV